VQEKLLEMQKKIIDLEEQNKTLRQLLETKGKLVLFSELTGRSRPNHARNS